MSEETVNDPLLEPFTDLNSRKIPIQDDKMRGCILTVYLIFLAIGVPVWLYCTHVPSNTVPLIYAEKTVSEFKVNVYYEGESLVPDWKEYSFAIGNYFFNVKNNGAFVNNVLSSDSMNLNLILSKETEIKRIGKRALKVPNSKEIKTVLTEIVDSFKIPNFRKSKIKLKFSFLTSKPTEISSFSNLNNLVSHLSPVLSFESTFQTKYFDEFSGLTEDFFIGPNSIVKFDSRDERGKIEIFNFVFIFSSEEIKESKNLFIPNWGIVVQGSKDFKTVEKVFISAFKRFLGFPKTQNLPEMFEIELWTEKLKEFYHQKSTELLKITSFDGSKVLKAKSTKEAFDMIETSSNDPKSLAAAYFPDDHKFAVYLPVYLPLILPILVGLIAIIKERKPKVKQE